jgi:hypothetical protein
MPANLPTPGGLDFLDALDVADAVDAAEFIDQAVEVADVDRLDDGATVCGGVGGRGADVGAVVGGDGGELLEQAGSVVAEVANGAWADARLRWSCWRHWVDALGNGVRARDFQGILLWDC